MIHNQNSARNRRQAAQRTQVAKIIQKSIMCKYNHMIPAQYTK